MKQIFGRAKEALDEEFAERYTEDGEYYAEGEEGYARDGEYYAEGEEGYAQDGEYYTEGEEGYAQDGEYYVEGEEGYAQDGEYYAEGEEGYARDGEYYAEGEEGYAQDGEYYAEGEEGYARDGEYYAEGEEGYAQDGEYYVEGEENYAQDGEYYAENQENYAQDGELYTDEISYEDMDSYNVRYQDDEVKEKKRSYNQSKEVPFVDHAIVFSSIAVLILAVILGVVFLNSKLTKKQVSGFASVGTQLNSISLIGEKGLDAIAEAQIAKLNASNMVEEEPEEEELPEYEENEYERSVTVVLNLTSIQKDLKIKFTNQKSGKLIPNVPFSVTVKDPDGKTSVWSDDDMDGIIYKKDIAAGTYEVSVDELTDSRYADYSIGTGKQSVVVKKDISYQKVDVTNEVKSESEIDAKKEDTAKNETEVESVLPDTVTWVESKVLLASYSEVPKNTIPDPLTIVSVKKNFMRMALAGSATIQAPSGNVVKVGEQITLSVNPVVTAGEGETITEIGPWTDIIWSSMQPDKATVNVDGVVTGVAAGETKIQYTAKANVTFTKPSETTEGGQTAEAQSYTEQVSVYGELMVTVQAQQGAKGELSVDSKTLSMVPGTYTCVLAIPKDYTQGKMLQFAVASDKPEVATAVVDETGKVTITAVGAGKAQITVTTDYAEGGGNQTASFAIIEVTVGNNKTIEFQDKKEEATAYVGNKVELKAYVGGVITATPEVSVESSNQTVLKVTLGTMVSENNKLTVPIMLEGIAEGTATITLKCKESEEEVKATCVIKVKPDPKQDRRTELKDKDDNLLFVLENNEYRQATYADYYTFEKFYIKGGEKYTGWQTIDGKVYFFKSDGTKVTGEQVIQGAKYTFASDGSLVTGSGVIGIDVSKWNGTIDWSTVKNSGISYAIIRCGYRGSSKGSLVEDPKFVTNIKGAIGAGIKVGVYFFTQAVDEREAVEEASMVLEQIKNYRITYPVFLDVEPSGGRGDAISKETRTAICKAFCQTIQNAGYTAGIYANKTWLETKLDASAISSYKIWLAQYAATPTYSGRYDMWQYRATGLVSGVSGNVDMNMSYLGY